MEEVATGFRAFVARTFGDDGRAWLATLPSLLEEIGARWKLELGAELHGGHLSYVCEAVTADGVDAVLKLGPPWPRVRHEDSRAPGLERGRAVAAAARRRAACAPARAHPPGDACRSRSPQEVASLLSTIHVAPPGGLPPLGETVRRRLTWASGQGRASDEKLSWALRTSPRLEQDPVPAVLVHGDFDERNLLVCTRRGLCAIDPLPCVGDPAYDAAYWVHANRRSGRRARLDGILAGTGLTRERVRDWAAASACTAERPPPSIQRCSCAGRVRGQTPDTSLARARQATCDAERADAARSKTGYQTCRH